MNTTNSKYDHINNSENYNLEVSAYQKEKKGDFKGAIKDISFALKNKNLDCFLFYERGKLFFKIKNYEKAINDLSEFISKSKDKSNLHRYYVESLFLKICCLKILNLHYWDEIQSLSDIKNQYSYGSYRKRLVDNYFNFIFALAYSLKKRFELSLDNLIKIRESDPNFLKNKYCYLLDHLPQEMKPILDICWHII